MTELFVAALKSVSLLGFMSVHSSCLILSFLFLGGFFCFSVPVYLLYLIHVIHNSVIAQQRKQIGLQKLVSTADSVTLYAGGFFRH